MPAVTVPPQIRSVSLSKFSQVAQSFGQDPYALLRQAGLDQSCLVSPDLRVPENAFAGLLEASAAQTPHAAIGLQMGASWRLSDFGHISLALQHQASLQALLGTLKEYQHLLSSTVAVETVQHGELAMLQLQLETGRSDPGRHPVELGVASVLSLCKHQLGSAWAPASVHFSHAAPASSSQHRRVFGCDVVFGADFDGIVLRRDDLQRPHQQHDQAMEQHARFLLDNFRPPEHQPGMAQQVERTIRALLPHGRHSLAQVAQAMGCTVRALQRQLEERGTSYQQCLDNVRTHAAKRGLSNARLSINEVAVQAGFAENSSFTRWFQSRHQLSPSQWRQQQGQG